MNEENKSISFHYIADPMCSQCYGITPLMEQVAAFCDANSVAFNLTMGGLRAGGGVPWDDGFKAFLSQEWAEINHSTGMPFDFSFFDQPAFNYDTEPACRAVVTAQLMLVRNNERPARMLEFFKAVQEQFYAHNVDLKELESYRTVCEKTGLNFEIFSSLFSDEQTIKATLQQFVQARIWKADDFPVLMINIEGTEIQLSRGFHQSKKILENLLAMQKKF